MNGRICAAILCAAAVSAVPTHCGGYGTVTFLQLGGVKFELNELTRHPLYWWPRTLLGYHVDFSKAQVRPRDLILTEDSTQEPLAFQLSEVEMQGPYLKAAKVNFFADLPSGGRRSCTLSTGTPVAAAAAVIPESRDGDSIVVDAGTYQVRIPASRAGGGEFPGPILQLARGGKWMGTSRTLTGKRKILRLDTIREEQGPLFATYKIVYTFDKQGTYTARVRVVAGYDFVALGEEMEGLAEEDGIRWELSWTGFHPTHRQAPNHPYLPRTPNVKKRIYDTFRWERIDERFVSTQHGVSSGFSKEGELPFRLGAYQPWGAYVILNSATFWDDRTNEALGIFIDEANRWQDNTYAIWSSANRLQVRYYYAEGVLSWRWPLTTGSRSTGIAVYDHAEDIKAVDQLAKLSKGFRHTDGLTYSVPLFPITHTMFLQNRYGTMDLDVVKDWLLEYPDTKRRPLNIFREGEIKTAAELERRIMTSSLAIGMMTSGTRQNAGFNPVASRSMYHSYTDAFCRLYPQMTPAQRQRLTAWYLMFGYTTAAEDLMPMRTMLAGHPNFLSDVKSVPALVAFLFPEHPMVKEWADQFERFVDLNTRYHVRPPVAKWESKGGRWTENLGTYVWAFLRPAVRAEFALRKYFDGKNRIANPGIAQIADWTLNALSAPFNGEEINRYKVNGILPQHFWGIVTPDQAPRRLHPPQGAHSARRMPPRVMWWLGQSLRNYRPLLAESLMWAARPTDDDSEHSKGEVDAWDIMYHGGDNRGTNPRLKTSKYTGYGIVLRAAVDQPGELSVHLQQIDEGPNYRWGIAGEGGNGVIYFYANGKSYSHNGREDVGDRAAHDTDFATNFGVWKDGRFKSIGRNVLERPLYDLGIAQFAEIVPRQDNPYSFPEYQSRSIFLVASDYFVTYDDLFNDAVAHRFSWFTHIGDDMPFIHFVKGGVRERERLFTKVETTETKGVWYDGIGDAMAVISHKPGLQVEAASFGATVKHSGGVDLVFLNPDGIAYAADAVSFKGDTGLVRKLGAGVFELALIHGSEVSAGGLRLAVDDPDLGISARLTKPGEAIGEFFGRKPGRLRITCDQCGGTRVFIDGAAQPEAWSGSTMMVALPAGHHRWQLTRGLPVPGAPVIVRTENASGNAKVLWSRMAGAERYRVEISTDGGTSWVVAGETQNSEFLVKGLTNGKKYHVRVTAANREHTSAPGPEYPIYATAEPPAYPDGLDLQVSNGAVRATWGSVLGAREYRLYRRKRGTPRWEQVYAGTATEFAGAALGALAAFDCPGLAETASRAQKYVVYEYAVTAVNGNGESAKSPIVDTDPTSWLNWDPRPGEPFRRRYTYNTLNYLLLGSEEQHERYYPR